MKPIALCILILGANFAFTQSQPDYTVHEWGTFTSVQGGDGELLSWRPLQTSELPGFVHNRSQPGMNRAPNGGLLLKGEMVTLQRMETPVIYFYSGGNLNVDVSVAFPKGLITEWYPQATQIGPSISRDTNAPGNASLPESRAVWKNLQVMAASKQPGSSLDILPQDKSGSHYFAARATGAGLVREDFTDQTTNASEVEKFIFYRGAGSFKTPLRVSVDAHDIVTVENTGAEKLPHLFLVSLHNGKGAFARMDGLAAGKSVPWQSLNATFSENLSRFPLAQFQDDIGAQMEAALVSEGLFADEAKAMVATWKDSWFAEEGERVLYILPRAWTDETLPMTLNPKPKSLVRVMVGRAEVLTPSAETQLFHLLTNARNGDVNARVEAAAQLKQRGRFAEPALRLGYTYQAGMTNAAEFGFQLLNGAVPSKFE